MATYGNACSRGPHRLLDTAWPKMAFVENSLEGDPTNWWVPNHAAVEALLRSCGWRSLQSIGEQIYLCADRSAGLPPGARPDVLTRLNE